MQLAKKTPYLGLIVVSAIGLGFLSNNILIELAIRQFGTPLKINPKKLLEPSHRIFGFPSAAYQLVLFSDYECTPCRKEVVQIDSLRRKDNVSLSLYQYPLKRIHPLAYRAACLSVSLAGEREWYRWHLRLAKERLCRETLDDLEKEICAIKCVDLKAAESIVDKDLAFGRQIGVQHTPTLFLVHRGKVFMIDNLEVLNKI